MRLFRIHLSWYEQILHHKHKIVYCAFKSTCQHHPSVKFATHCTPYVFDTLSLSRSLALAQRARTNGHKISWKNTPNRPRIAQPGWAKRHTHSSFTAFQVTARTWLACARSKLNKFFAPIGKVSSVSYSYSSTSSPNSVGEEEKTISIRLFFVDRKFSSARFIWKVFACVCSLCLCVCAPVCIGTCASVRASVYVCVELFLIVWFSMFIHNVFVCLSPLSPSPCVISTTFIFNLPLMYMF